MASLLALKRGYSREHVFSKLDCFTEEEAGGRSHKFKTRAKYRFYPVLCPHLLYIYL